MKWVFALTLVAIAAQALPSAVPASSKSLRKKAAQPNETHASAHVQPGKTSSRVASARGVRRSSSRVHRARVAPAPSYQLHPDLERYQEIQKALADRGYFKGEVNGSWGDDSVDALQRFQTDHKLENDGKINALTLTGLGLGPKHDSMAGPSKPEPPSTPPPLPISVPQ